MTNVIKTQITMTRAEYEALERIIRLIDKCIEQYSTPKNLQRLQEKRDRLVAKLEAARTRSIRVGTFK